MGRASVEGGASQQDLTRHGEIYRFFESLLIKWVVLEVEEAVQ